MSNVIKCSQCQASLTLSEAAGGENVACPACAATVLVPAHDAAAALVSGPPVPAPQQTASTSAIAAGGPWPGAAMSPALNLAWNKVREGLHLMFMGLLITPVIVLARYISIVLVSLLMQAAGASILFDSRLWWVAILIPALAGGGVCLLGLAWGLANPDPKSRRLLVALLRCLAVNILVPIIGWSVPAPFDLAWLFVAVLTMCLFLVSVVFFILYLKAIAQFFRNESLTRSFGHAVIFQYIFIALMIAHTAVCCPVTIFPIGLRTDQFFGAWYALIGFIAISVETVFCLWLVVLLRRTRNMVSEALGARTM